MTALRGCLCLTLGLAGCYQLEGNIRYNDPVSFEFLEGVEASTGASSDVSNGSGRLTLETPEAGAFVITAIDPSGERPIHRTYHNGYDGEWSQSYALVREADAADIASALGVTLDPAKAIVEVTTIWLEAGGRITEMLGARVDLDAAYDIAVIQDFDAESGWVPGNLIPVAVDFATVVFANVAPGDVHITLTPPEPVDTCGAWPSELDDAWDGTLPVVAGEVAGYTFLCTRASDALRVAADGSRMAQALALFTALGIHAELSPPQVAGGALTLSGVVSRPDTAGPSSRVRFEARGAPAEAPTQIDLVSQGGEGALSFSMDSELATAWLELGGERASSASNPDGTFTLDGAVYPNRARMVHALAGDPRLEALTEAQLSGAIVASYALALAAPTRMVADSTSFETKGLTHTGFLGQLGCARFGDRSDPCRLWTGIRGQVR